MSANSSRDLDLPSGVEKRAVVAVFKTGVGVVGLVQGGVSTARVVARGARAGSTVSSSAGSHAFAQPKFVHSAQYACMYIYLIGIPGR